MVKIVHLLDDAALGGVTRLLDSLIGRLDHLHDHLLLVTRTRFRLAPSLDARIIVVHFTMAWGKVPFLFMLALRHPRSRLILVEHSYTEFFEKTCVKRRRRFRMLLRLAYRLVDHVIAVSQGQGRWIVEAGLATPDRLTIIPCVLDLAPFLALPIPAPAANAPLRLGAFGRFHRQKGFDLLIEAMRQISPSEAELQIAGYGEDEDSLRQAAAGLPHVTIGGRVEPTTFLSELDVVVMPSRWEAGAVTCWEVRASGRSMIVSAVDGLPEQVPPEIGIVVPPNDANSIAAAIRQLAGIDRRGMAIRARASTAGAFERTLRAWAALLDEPTGTTRWQIRRPLKAILREGYTGQVA